MPHKIILGSKGEQILVDEEDFDRLNKFSWNCYGGYARRFERRVCDEGKLKGYSMHREVLTSIPEGKVVDHINGNKLDNRKSNLRVCEVAQNSMNRKSAKGTSSKYLGVTYHTRDKRWQAQVRNNKERFFCGYFKTEEEAARAYDKKALELHGEYANLNFKEEGNSNPSEELACAGGSCEWTGE